MSVHQQNIFNELIWKKMFLIYKYDKFFLFSKIKLINFGT